MFHLLREAGKANSRFIAGDVEVHVDLTKQAE
jgi:hypothetical protein